MAYTEPSINGHGAQMVMSVNVADMKNDSAGDREDTGASHLSEPAMRALLSSGDSGNPFRGELPTLSAHWSHLAQAAVRRGS